MAAPVSLRPSCLSFRRARSLSSCREAMLATWSRVRGVKNTVSSIRLRNSGLNWDLSSRLT